MALTALECKNRGNSCFWRKNYEEALNWYCRGLETAGTNDPILLSNRSQAFLCLDKYQQALEDAEASLIGDPNNLKTLYRKAKAMCGLRKYSETIQFINSIDLGIVSDVDIEKKNKLIDLKNQLEKQLSGDYDMRYFMKNPTGMFIECAEYTAPVKIALVPGKGRGLISEQHISPGQLIIASKALALSSNGIPGKIETRNLLLMNLIQNLNCEPGLGKLVYSLYAGDKLGYLDTNQEQWDIVDTSRLLKICEKNFFNRNKSNISDDGTMAGLWYMPSFINHKCVDTNALYEIYGSFMFVRAFKDIQPGQEITMDYINPLTMDSFDCDCRLCVMDISQPEVRKRRKQIAREIEEKAEIFLPANICHLKAKEVAKIESQVLELKDMRPDHPDLNCDQLILPNSLLSNHYALCEGNFEKAAALLEEVYFLQVNTFAMGQILTTSERIVGHYISANDLEKARKWLKILETDVTVIYGPEVTVEDVSPEFYSSIELLHNKD